MQKKLYIGTNTKMYKTIRQTVAFLDRLGSLTRDIDRSLLELFGPGRLGRNRPCLGHYPWGAEHELGG